MEHETKTAKYLTNDPTSFGWPTARSRWPIIITQAVDDAHRAVNRTEPGEKQEEGKKIVEELGKLRYEIQHDRALSPIQDDGNEDAALYNNDLQKLASPSWQNAPWLFCECYLFRRLHTIFTLSKNWKNYDVFAQQKIKTFRSSRPAVLELAARYQDLVETIRKAEGHVTNNEAEKTIFKEMSEICLWGNATDLSLLTSLTYEDIQKLQGSEARKASEKNILVNDLDQVYDHLLVARDEGRTERRVDIVLDNAGFELYVDLILAGYLLSAGLATTVVLHPKSMPWFVSDVIPADFASLLGALADPRRFYEVPTEDDHHLDITPAPLSEKEVGHMEFLFHEWSNLHAEGQLVLRPNPFWTYPSSFWRLPSEAEDLYQDLKTSELVIFKGDLNYRKLTGDAKWDPTTPFTEAIGPLGPGSGVNVLALRTCKADVVVGLDPGVDEKLRHLEDGGGSSGARKWAWNGKWAVVSFSKGK